MPTTAIAPPSIDKSALVPRLCLVRRFLAAGPFDTQKPGAQQLSQLPPEFRKLSGQFAIVALEFGVRPIRMIVAVVDVRRLPDHSPDLVSERNPSLDVNDWNRSDYCDQPEFVGPNVGSGFINQNRSTGSIWIFNDSDSYPSGTVDGCNR